MRRTYQTPDPAPRRPHHRGRRRRGRHAVPSALHSALRSGLRRALLLSFLAFPGVAALACGGPESAVEPGLTADEFVAVVVALREAEREVADEDSAAARFEERKAEILSRFDTTDEELRAFVVDHGQDLTALSETWDTIADRLKHVSPMDSLGNRELRRLKPEAVGEQTLH